MATFAGHDSYKSISVDVEDSIVTIKFQKPEKYNPISTDVILDLRRAFDEIQLDRSIDAVIITGAGEKSFSSGGDIREYAGPAEDHVPTEKERGDLYFETWKQLYNLHPVTVAKINGYCVGGGMILASYCDLAISIRDAKFGVPTCNIGTTPDDGSTYRLIQLMGERRVKELVYTASLISAEEALNLGFVNSVVNEDELEEKVNNMVKDIQSNGSNAVKNSKRALNYSANSSDLDKAREYEDEVWWEQFRSEERERLVDQFLE